MRAGDAEKRRQVIGESYEMWVNMLGGSKTGDESETVILNEWRDAYHQAVTHRKELELIETELAELREAKQCVRVYTDEITSNFKPSTFDEHDGSNNAPGPTSINNKLT